MTFDDIKAFRAETLAAKSAAKKASASARAVRAAETRAARKVEAERAETRFAEVRAIVATGVCPCCGKGLRSNLAITGWWQCEGYASGACNWQAFTA